MATLLVAFALGTGATPCTLGTEIMGIGGCSTGSAGLLLHSDQWQHDYRPGTSSSHRPPSPGRSPRASSIARVLVGIESFTFDGKATIITHESYEKDADGGRIWGNGICMIAEHKAAPQAIARARKSAFAYSYPVIVER